MADKLDRKDAVDIDVTSLSHSNLVKIITELKDSDCSALHKKAQKELAERLKRKGHDNREIARMLVANEYGKGKRKLIAQEWAGALGITKG